MKNEEWKDETSESARRSVIRKGEKSGKCVSLFVYKWKVFQFLTGELKREKLRRMKF